MKKIYLLALFTSVASISFAQYKSSATRTQVKTNDGSTTQRVEANSAQRDVTCIYSNTFNNAADWVSGIDPAGNPNVDWQIGIGLEPSGPTAIATLESTTAGDGIALMDSDLQGVSGTFENNWITLLVPINCTNFDHVSVQFESFYRKWTGSGVLDEEHCILEVSTNPNVWPDITTYEDTEAPGQRWEIYDYLDVQGPVPNPDVKIIDISSAAANQPAVYLRFRWVGSWGYAWMLDDLCVFETFANDLSANNVYNGDILGNFEYHSIPTSQLEPLIFGAVIQNYGYQDQTVDATFSGLPADVIINQPFMASQIDTIWTAPTAIDATIGPKAVTVTLPMDDENSFNTMTTNFEVTENSFSHCDNEPDTQRGFNQDDVVSIGADFLMVADADATGVQVWFGLLTTDNVALQVVISEVITNIQDLNFVGSSVEFNLDPAAIDNGYVTIGFEDAYGLSAGVEYVVEVIKIEENSDRMYLRANNYDDDLGTVCYGPFGTGNAVNWFNGWSFTPAIRLILNDNEIIGQLPIAIKETSRNEGLELQQNIPNPATDNTVINYSLKFPESVSLSLRDMTGRLVLEQDLGQRSSGSQQHTLNVANLVSGIYTYTITAGETSLTKELMVK